VSRKPTAWSDRERPIVDTAVQALLRGEYVTIRDAARACYEHLSRLRREVPEAQSPHAPKTLVGVYAYIGNRTRGKRLHGSGTSWTESEDRVLRRYVRALLAGRYHSVRDAVHACVREFDKERRRDADKGRAALSRSPEAIATRVWKQANAAGLAQIWHPFARSERVVLDRYARALAEGKYRDLTPATRDCLKELNRSRMRQSASGRPPQRTLSSMKEQLRVRAHNLGWSWGSSRWSPEELRILSRFVRRLTVRGHPTTQQVATECYAALKRYQDRLTRTLAGRRAVGRFWTFPTIYTYLARQSGVLGRKWEARWKPDEDKVLRRYALGIVEGRIADAPTAALACVDELARLYPRTRGSGRASARTLETVECRIARMAREMHRPWPGSHWTDAERKVCRRWTDWYERHRRVPRNRALATSAEGLQEELERMNSRRSMIACRAIIWKEHLRRVGLA